MIALTLAVCLLTASAQPLFLAPGASIAFTAAGGLVLTPAVGAATTIPTGALIVGKAALATKLLLLKAYLDERAKNEKAD